MLALSMLCRMDEEKVRPATKATTMPVNYPLMKVSCKKYSIFCSCRLLTGLLSL